MLSGRPLQLQFVLSGCRTGCRPRHRCSCGKLLVGIPVLIWSRHCWAADRSSRSYAQNSWSLNIAARCASICRCSSVDSSGTSKANSKSTGCIVYGIKIHAAVSRVMNAAMGVSSPLSRPCGRATPLPRPVLPSRSRLIRLSNIRHQKNPAGRLPAVRLSNSRLRFLLELSCRQAMRSGSRSSEICMHLLFGQGGRVRPRPPMPWVYSEVLCFLMAPSLRWWSVIFSLCFLIWRSSLSVSPSMAAYMFSFGAVGKQLAAADMHWWPLLYGAVFLHSE